VPTAPKPHMGPQEAAKPAHRNNLPAYLRVTEAETWLAPGIVIIAAVGMQIALPTVFPYQRWALPGLAGLLMIGLVKANPRRVCGDSGRVVHTGFVVLVAVVAVGSALSAGRLVIDLTEHHGAQDARSLFMAGAALWLINVTVFALVYWDLDCDGPIARVGIQPKRDFWFPQLDPEKGQPDWEPELVDYLYLAFTNATAFSPTDVSPLTTRAKITMMLQSAVSLITLVVVIARAVAVLK
jgi:uncharacterized membrane protein